jgi:pimeloyl-CoA synthetase
MYTHGSKELVRINGLDERERITSTSKQSGGSVFFIAEKFSVEEIIETFDLRAIKPSSN